MILSTSSIVRTHRHVGSRLIANGRSGFSCFLSMPKVVPSIDSTYLRMHQNTRISIFAPMLSTVRIFVSSLCKQSKTYVAPCVAVGSDHWINEDSKCLYPLRLGPVDVNVSWNAHGDVTPSKNLNTTYLVESAAAVPSLIRRRYNFPGIASLNKKKRVS